MTDEEIEKMIDQYHGPIEYMCRAAIEQEAAFARAIGAATREECAKVCDRQAKEFGNHEFYKESIASDDCAEAIREMK